jgi:hypothetical protein
VPARPPRSATIHNHGGQATEYLHLRARGPRVDEVLDEAPQIGLSAGL